MLRQEWRDASHKLFRSAPYVARPSSLTLRRSTMLANNTLKGRRIAVLAADGFEKVELTIPVNALRLARASVALLSLRHGRSRGVTLPEPASRGHVDKTLAEANPADYDAMLVPGGFINPDLLRQS